MKVLLGFLIASFVYVSISQAQTAGDEDGAKNQYMIKESAIVSGAIIESNNDDYIMSASAGQVAIDSVGNDNFRIYFGFWDHYSLVVGLPLEDFLLPNEFKLKQNYPNPFNPETNIDYDLPTMGDVTIEVYNILGQKIVELINQRQEAGYHSIKWRGININGNVTGNGMYYYRIIVRTTEGKMFTKTKKMLFLK